MWCLIGWKGIKQTTESTLMKLKCQLWQGRDRETQYPYYLWSITHIYATFIWPSLNFQGRQLSYLIHPGQWPKPSNKNSQIKYQRNWGIRSKPIAFPYSIYYDNLFDFFLNMILLRETVHFSFYFDLFF